MRRPEMDVYGSPIADRLSPSPADLAFYSSSPLSMRSPLFPSPGIANRGSFESGELPSRNRESSTPEPVSRSYRLFHSRANVFSRSHLRQDYRLDSTRVFDRTHSSRRRSARVRRVPPALPPLILTNLPQLLTADYVTRTRSATLSSASRAASSATPAASSSHLRSATCDLNSSTTVEATYLAPPHLSRLPLRRPPSRQDSISPSSSPSASPANSAARLRPPPVHCSPLKENNWWS